jgi:hypothetical protein
MSRIGSMANAIDRLNLFQPLGETPPPSLKQDHNSIFNAEGSATMPLLDQGRTNGCGTTSLAMVMTFLGQPRTQAEIDDAVRRQDIFSTPNDLAEYARDAGLSAEVYNHGTAAELAHYVDLGIPTQILTTADGSGDASKMHYVVITGYDVATDGSLSFDVQNPWGIRETWTADELERRWGNTPFGFDHLYLAVAPGDVSLPPSRTDGIEGTLNAADGVASVVAGYDRLIHARSPGEFLRGIGDVSIGAPQAIVGGVLGGLQLGANYAETQIRDVPIIGVPLAAGLDHFEQRLGTVNLVVGAFSNSMAHVHSSIEHFADGELLAGASDLLQSQGDLAQGAWNASVDVVTDTVQSVADIGVGVADVVADTASSVSHAVGSAIDSAGSWTGWW